MSPPPITVITSPKPFIDPLIRQIQLNALRNWKALGLEVLVFGDEEGVAQACQQVGVTHIPQVERNAWGTPLLSDMLDQARKATASPWLMLANADILFTPGLLQAAERLEAQQAVPCLVTGRRWDVDIQEELDFQAPRWPQDLCQRAQRQGRLNPTGMDYFLFPRELPLHMPPLAIGRSGWDNWMIYNARHQGWKVVDATPDVLVVHQNHHYHHLPGGQPPYRLEETRHNIHLAGGENRMFTLWEATHVLRQGRLEPVPWTWMRPLRWVELALLRQGFPERGWKRIALRVVRRRLQAALLRPPDWWQRYYRMSGPCA